MQTGFIYFRDMDIARYTNIERTADFKQYSFISKGPKGNLLKIVRFIPFHQIPDTYNLALGTVRQGDEVDYFETSDNNDRDKILSTIFQIGITFIDAYPDKKIFIIGRNASTTRLYRAAINHGYDHLITDLIIYGVTYLAKEDTYSTEIFIRNKQYDAFLFEKR